MTTERKPGRPKKARALSETIRVRFGTEERSRIEQVAKAKGVNISQLVRSIVKTTLHDDRTVKCRRCGHLH